MHIISFLTLVWITQSVGYVTENPRLSPLPYLPVESEEESGDDPDCQVNMTRLEEMVKSTVDMRMEELKSRFISRVHDLNENVKHARHRTHSFHRFQEQRKDKLKSLEFRILRLSKDLEATKSTLAKQTEALSLSKRLSDAQQTIARDINQKHTRLEGAVVNLAEKITLLAKSLQLNSVDVPRFILPRRLSRNMVTVSTSRLYPRDCHDVYRDMSNLFHGNFHITIKPDGALRPFTALCTVFDNKGWTVIQRRFNGSVDFYRTWGTYKAGFGTAQGEFWIGNENIHHLTKNGQMSLRVVMKDWENVEYQARYDHFRIDSEDELFRLHVRGYHGNAGDSLTSTWESHDGQPFSTHDRDNDARFHDNCSEHFHGAWWFNSCFTSHLNGKYFSKENHKNYFIRNGIRWNTLHMYASLKSSMMMVAPRTDQDS